MTLGTSLGPRRRARLVLVVGVAFGLAYLLYRALFAPSWVGIDFRVFRGAAGAFWEGGAVYGTSPVGVDGLSYRYPPIWLAWFSLSLLVGPAVGFLVHVAGTLAAATALGLVIVRVTERHGVALEPLDRALVLAFVAVGSYGVPSVFYGNVNHHMALAVGLGFYWLADGRQGRSGVAMATAALLKLFPAGFGLWFLHRRSWRAVAAALATGLGGLALGILLFGPATTRAYVEVQLLSRAAPAAFAGGLPPSSEYVSLLRPLSVLFPGVAVGLLTLLAVALLAPAVALLYRREAGPTDRLVAQFATLSAVLLVLPSYSLYFLVLAYPLVPLLYLLEGRPGRRFAVGAGISLLTVKLPEVALLVGALPLPSSVATTALAVSRAVYTLGTPVLWGTLLMLAACLWRARDRPSSPAGATAAARRGNN